MACHLFTIGHSRHSIGYFIDLLQQHRISVLVDVRSHPRSRFSPHFNRENVHRSLTDAGIEYIFKGRELGARSDNAACHRDGKADYHLIAEDPHFRDALEWVRAESGKSACCLMCAEKDPLDCHRTMLVGIRLRSAALSLTHILADGDLEAHEQTELRLVKRYHLDQPDLFRTETECLTEAYRIHCDAIAYRTA